ncbi:hypothetical protein BCAH1134_C0555 (plasmid) [Bacillus cereus AH1134]|nr:hypothetical protein BCAH1134_C0555 [Bacillus cereus AH1134]
MMIKFSFLKLMEILYGMSILIRISYLLCLKGRCSSIFVMDR